MAQKMQRQQERPEWRQIMLDSLVCEWDMIFVAFLSQLFLVFFGTKSSRACRALCRYGERPNLFIVVFVYLFFVAYFFPLGFFRNDTREVSERVCLKNQFFFSLQLLSLLGPLTLLFYYSLKKMLVYVDDEVAQNNR